MTNEELLAIAEIVEKLTNRYRDQEAAHKAALTEIRASFNARTSADEKIIEGLRAEIIRVNEAHGRTKVENDGLLDELAAQRDAFTAEVARLKAQTPKQHPAKVAAWVRRTDEGYPDAPTGYMAQVLSVTYRVRDQSGSVVFWYSSFCEPCDPPQTEPVPKRAHPVTKGEYVKVSNGAVTQVLEVHKDWYLVSGGHGWTFANCSPYDPPEATHDTEAGKAAAEAALKTEPVAEEIKVGDLVEVKQ